MDEENQYSETVNKAARTFRKRGRKNKTNLLDVLKQTREAAGLPLVPVKADTFQPDTDNDIKEEEKPPSAKPTSIIKKSPLQQEISNPPHDVEPDHVRDTLHDAKDQHYQAYVQPERNEHSSNEVPWQDNKSLIECNSYMLAQEIGCDVTLIVGENQEAIQAHSYVLSSRSSKFANILAADRNLGNKLAAIPDVKPDTFRLLLRYLYTDDIELSVDTAIDLIPVTYTYGPTSLKTSCFNFLLSAMNADNVCVILEHAHTYSESSVYDRCMQFIFVNAVDVLKSPKFQELCQECVENIVKSDDLNAKEFLIFEALALWANRRCSRKRLQPTDVNKRRALGTLVFHVRFATMDVLEFTQKISHSEILNREEKVSLYQFFHGETHILPSQFNKRKRHEYVVNHDLITRAIGKSETKEYFPDIQPQTGSPVIPYKHLDNYEGYLPIKRVIRFQGVEKNLQMGGPDAIGFRVSVPIILRGVQAFGPSTDKDSYEVDVVVYDYHGDIVCREQKTITSEKSLQVYDINLTSPVQVPAGRRFTVQLTVRGKPTYRGINGLDFVVNDGVGFEFFKSDRSCKGTTIGQIPTILFSKVGN